MSDPTDDVNDKTNVTPFRKPKGNTKPKDDTQKNNKDTDKDKITLKFATVERDLCGLLEGVKPPLLYNLPDFPYKFEIVQKCPTDAALSIMIADNTATIVPTTFVASKIRHYVQFLTDDQADYAVRRKGCEEIAETWSRMYVHREYLPKAVGFLSDPELCLNRLPYDPVAVSLDELKVKAPFFRDYLDRMTNADAFCARVGSLFDPTAHRKQAVWMQGPKDAGKSPLSELICGLVGAAFVVISETGLEEQFWKESVVGKRAVILNEIRPRFLRSEDFKNITGDRIHYIRPFRGKPYQSILEPILFFFSNHPPEVPNDEPIAERIIACSLEVIPKIRRISDTKLRKSLEAELPFIAGYCLEKWKLIPEGQDIPCGTEVISKAIESYESRYLDFISNYLDIEPEGSGVHYLAENTKVEKLMGHADFRSNTDKSICKRIILTQPRVSQTRTNPRWLKDGRRVNCYSGARIKPEHHELVKFLMTRNARDAARYESQHGDDDESERSGIT